MRSIEIICSGRVQGVFFRASTQSISEKLGLIGWVKNEPDGSVRMVASGNSEGIDNLIKWCQQGPVGSNVTHVLVRELDEEPTGQTTFEIRRS